VAGPLDPRRDAFLRLVDRFDAEANAVIHAVVRAHAVVQSVVEDAGNLLDQPDADERTWAQLGLRLIQHRAALVQALAALAASAVGGSEDDGAASPAPPRSSVTAVSVPSPPRPRCLATAAPSARSTAETTGTTFVPAALAVPAPPEARTQPVA
jgi:hypothetical protein